jgi:hypothetical protein
MYNVDDGSMDEDTDFLSSHRCSMVKRYYMPTFFTPDKIQPSTSNRTNASPSNNMEFENTLNVM